VLTRRPGPRRTAARAGTPPGRRAVGRAGWPAYSRAIRSMTAQAASPSSRSVTRPRTRAVAYGCSRSVIEIATRGSRARSRSEGLRHIVRLARLLRRPGWPCGQAAGDLLAALVHAWKPRLDLGPRQAAPRAVVHLGQVLDHDHLRPQRLRVERGRTHRPAERTAEDGVDAVQSRDRATVRPCGRAGAPAARRPVRGPENGVACHALIRYNVRRAS
jgi:hypothetical protein